MITYNSLILLLSTKTINRLYDSEKLLFSCTEAPKEHERQNSNLNLQITHSIHSQTPLNRSQVQAGGKRFLS